MPTRKIIQIAVSDDGGEPSHVPANLFALADDGSLWLLPYPCRQDKPESWVPLPGLPSPDSGEG